MNAPPGIDPDALARLNRMGGEDFVRQMINLFLEEAPERLSVARSGEKAGDFGEVGEAAHSLKSSARNFGAEHFANLAEDLERTARTGDEGKIAAGLLALEQAYAPVKAWLETQREILNP